MNLYFVMMPCTVRARISVPPPGPAVATNSIGFVGFHAACAGAAAHKAAKPAQTIHLVIELIGLLLASVVRLRYATRWRACLFGAATTAPSFSNASIS